MLIILLINIINLNVEVFCDFLIDFMDLIIRDVIIILLVKLKGMIYIIIVI